MNLGKKINLLRKSKKLTQLDLAKSLFVSYQLVSKWEHNIAYPTAETLLDIVNIYQLPLNFFSDDDEWVNDLKISEKERVFVGFTECMLQSYNDYPTIHSIASVANISETTIRKYFNSINELIYAYIVYVDQSIKIEVEQKIAENKNILNIFLEDMAPLLYRKRLELNVLYTRSYIKNIWTSFIRSKYKRILSNHKSVVDINSLELEYSVELLISFISTWLSQQNPENLEDFQSRIKKMTSVNINQWRVFSD
jgi:transcriptional regulator with XRE-family HTH domain